MHQKMLVTAIPCAALAATAAIASAVAAPTPVYDTLGPSNAFNTAAVASFGLVNGTDGQRALQFTPSQTVRLTSLDLALGRVLIGQGSGPATVQLTLDSNNSPGPVVETFTTPTISSTDGQLVTLTSSSGATLAAGKTYWLTLGRAPGSNLGGGWFMSNTATPATLAGRLVGDAWSVSTLPRPTAARVTGVPETLPGDASEDGQISFDDYVLLDRGIAKHLTGWNNGDFNGDAVVDRNDYLILDASYIQHHAAAASILLPERQSEFGDAYVAQLIAAVPEPASTLLAAGALALPALTRRRRA